MRVLTEAVQFKADAKLITFVEQKMNKLDTFFDRIIESRVTMKLENVGQVKDKIVEVSLHVPGDKIFVRESDKTFEAAVDKTVDSLKRQLIRYKERQRGHA